MSTEICGCGLEAWWHRLLGFLALAAGILPDQPSAHTSGCNCPTRLGWGAGCGWGLVLCRPHRVLASSDTQHGSGRQRRRNERPGGGRLWDVPGMSLSSDFLAFPSSTAKPKEEAGSAVATPCLNQADPPHTCFYF